MKAEIIERFIKEIQENNGIEDFEESARKLYYYVLSEGDKTLAAKIEEVSSISRNKFSKMDEKDRLRKAKQNLCKILQNAKGNTVSELSDVRLVTEILKNFKDSLECMFETVPHAKCGKSVKVMCEDFQIENEYDLQHVLYAILRGYFPLARREEYQDTGCVAVRKDICIDESNIVIELKCTRSGMTERMLADEIAADMIHYDSENIFFYIYDKAKVISNVHAFIKANEEQKIGKNIYVFVETGDLVS